MIVITRVIVQYVQLIHVCFRIEHYPGGPPFVALLRGGEGTVDWDTLASNCSTWNCLCNFNERISSKARIEKSELEKLELNNLSSMRVSNRIVPASDLPLGGSSLTGVMLHYTILYCISIASHMMIYITNYTHTILYYTILYYTIIYYTLVQYTILCRCPEARRHVYMCLYIRMVHMCIHHHS